MDYEIVAKPKEMFGAMLFIVQEKGGVIDEQDAREMAMYLFGVDKSVVDSARIIVMDDFIHRGHRSVQFPSAGEVHINKYGGRDEFHWYAVRFGYEPKSNIILYSTKIEVEHLRDMLKG